MMTSMKEQPIHFEECEVLAALAGRKTQARQVVREGELSCRYGNPGDRLFVRESFRAVYGPAPAYEMSFEYQAGYMGDFFGETAGYWIPSCRMPREASRLLLTITEIRKHRLHDITDAEIIAEGITAPFIIPPGAATMMDFFKSRFTNLYGVEMWRSNPEVWAISFERVAP